MTMKWIEPDRQEMGAHKARNSELQDGEVLAFHASPRGGHDVRVRVLRPTLHPELADAFEAANREALRRHAVDGVISPGCPLRARTATWLIVAERPGHCGANMAGIRLDLRTPAQPLSLERIVPRFGAQQVALLHGRFVGSVGELTGMWVHEEFRKLGLPILLISAGIAVARLAGLDRLFAFPPLHTAGLFDAQGFHITREMGDDGAFQYPNEHYRSWVMELDLAPHAPAEIGIQMGGGRVARSDHAVQLQRLRSSLRDLGSGRPVSRVLGHGNGGYANA
jgi:GNAT superfamily N-acetyltransferase